MALFGQLASSSRKENSEHLRKWPGDKIRGEETWIKYLGNGIDPFGAHISAQTAVFVRSTERFVLSWWATVTLRHLGMVLSRLTTDVSTYGHL